MTKSRHLGVAMIASCFVALGAAPACGEKKSGIMLAITTDMKAPKDVNAVSVTISTNNAIKHNVIGRVTPQGEVLLPATLAIAEPDDPNASIRIRVMAFQERKARVLRDVRTSIPSGGRVALLRIPLNFVNDESVIGNLPANVLPAPNPGTALPGAGSGDDAGASGSIGGAPSGGDLFDPTVFVPNCANPEHTWIDGECKDAYIDPKLLPDFDEKLVGSGTEAGVCFDVRKCFASATVLGGAAAERPGPAVSEDEPSDGRPQIRPQNFTLDAATCTVRIEGASSAQGLNLAIVTPDTGECLRPGECYVPIDTGAGGWIASGSEIKLPSFVCRIIQSKGLRLATANVAGCVSKKEENPVCVELAPAASDGDGGVTPSPGNRARVVPEAFASSVAIGAEAAYLVGSTRTSRISLSSSSPVPEPVSGVDEGKLPWVLSATPSGALLVNGVDNRAYALNGSVATRYQLPPQARAYAGAYASESGRNYFAVGPQGNVSGIYASSEGPTLVKETFSMAGVIDEPTAITGDQAQLVIGTSKGQIIGCDVRGNTCGPISGVGPGRIDGLVPSPIHPRVGYALIQDGVYRLVLGEEGAVDERVRMANGNVSGAMIDGNYYPRALAVAGSCVFFTSEAGLAYATDYPSPVTPTILVPATSDKPLLGVAIGPSDSGASHAIYYTLYAPIDQEGGLWRAPVPNECLGGDVDPTPPPADAGIGLDAGEDCLPPSADCFDHVQCCSGTCIEGKCMP